MILGEVEDGHAESQGKSSGGQRITYAPETTRAGDQRRSVTTVAKALNSTRRTWTTLEYRPSLRPVTDGPGRCAHSYGSDALVPVERGLGPGAGRTNQQAGRLICARICARDAAGHAETQEAWYDFMPQVCRGQRGERRLSKTGETYVVVLITQRSRVQIPPPLPSLQVRGLFRSWKGPSACAVCTELCARPLRGPPRRPGGEAYPRTSVVTQSADGRTSTEARRPDVCDRLQMKCNPSTIGS